MVLNENCRSASEEAPRLRPTSASPLDRIAHLLATGLLLIAAACHDGVVDGFPRPDALILISLDTLRADYLNLYGYREFETSPFLDELAHQSFVFEHAITTEPQTLPSHASLFTGLQPLRHGARAEHMLGPRPATMASLLGQAGYRTAGFADGGFLRPRWGLGRGFDGYEGKPQRGFRRVLDEATTWLGRHGHEPFFLFLHTYDVHSREQGLLYQSRGPWRGRFVRALDAEAAALDPDDIARRIAFGSRSIRPADVRYVRASYAEGVRDVDELLRGFFEHLQAEGIADRAWIIVWSDHGEGLRDHEAWLHDELYDHTVRSVLLVRPPGGLDESRRIERVISAVDVLPTVLELCRVGQPELLDGRSFLDVLRGTATTMDQPAFSVRGDGDQRQYSIRTRSHHYLVDQDGGNPQLFALEDDPKEQRNLAGSGLAVENALHAELLRWSAQAEGLERVPSRRARPKTSAEAEAELRALGYLDTETE